MPLKKVIGRAIDWRTPKLQGKTFVLAGRMFLYYPLYRQTIEAEGGEVVNKVTAALDFVLVQDRASGAQSAAAKQADKLNRSKGSNIRVLDTEEFRRLLALSREEALAMLRGGPQGIERWHRRRGDGNPLIILPDLREADFRKASLGGVNFWNVPLDGADFRDADLAKASLPRARRLRCDGARLASASLGKQTDGSFIKAELSAARLRNLTNCDFTGANLEKAEINDDIDKEKCAYVVFRRANLRQASMENIRFHKVDFTGADLSGVKAKEATFTASNFTRARLDGADLDFCSLEGAWMIRASLAGASLCGARLRGADLRRADLRGANLANVDLRGARLDGANFEEANVRGARIDEAAAGKAKRLDPESCRGATVGPHLRTLQEIAGRTHWLNMKADLEFSGSRVQLMAGQSKRRAWGNWDHFTEDEKRWGYEDPPSLAEAMVRLANRWPGGELQVASIQVEHKKTPRAEELPALAVAAWCEAFGLPVPGADGTTSREETKEQRQQRLREEYLAELRGGPDGVRQWNVRSRSGELAAVCPSFAGSDLSGADLTEVCFRQLDFSDSRFDRAALRRSKTWWRGQFQEASFRQADLTEVDWRNGVFTSSVFDGATLVRTLFDACNFTRASFRKSDLRGACFRSVNLDGADLSSADLTGAQFDFVYFDENTRFPPGFALPDGLRWHGEGADPRTRIKPSRRLSFDEFIQQLPRQVEPARLAKALKMLKTERFRLYSRVDKKCLIGVVKSQTNPDLIYSCRLAKDGAFACCTQNLNLCGGLSGGRGLCKHLLVLVVGLTKAGELNPGRADAWVRASRYHHPQLEREEMAEAFLHYKGAEAGEIDWRPTETIPEDYYAL